MCVNVHLSFMVKKQKSGNSVIDKIPCVMMVIKCGYVLGVKYYLAIKNE